MEQEEQQQEASLQVNERSEIAKSEEGLVSGEQSLTLKRLLAAHEAWFDVYEGYAFAGHEFPGYAEFRSHGEKYLLVKSAKLWEVNAFEYLFFDFADEFNDQVLDDCLAFIAEKAIGKVEPDSNHMTSYLSLVVIANTVDEKTAKRVKRSRFHKEFKFGLNGWADMRLGVVDLNGKRVLTNSMGKKLKPLLEANAFSVDKGKEKES